MEVQEKKGSGLPANARFHAGFWDKDPESTGARKAYLKIIIMGGLMVCVAIWCVLTIYWGALWRTFSLIHGIHGCVVDFDGGDVGSTVSQYIGAISAPDQLTWEVHPASMYPNGPSDFAEAIVQEKCWVGISINPGATANLALATTESDATYDGSLAITAYTNEARNENAYSFLILPNVRGPLETVVAQYAQTYAKTLATRQNLATIFSQAPSIVTAPIYFTIDNLRPFDIAVAAAVDFVGLIYLLILSFFISGQHFNARLISGIQHRLKLRSILILRIVAPICTYFFVSLMYSVLSLAYLVPFDRTFGKAGFFIYWMMSFCAMTALGLALEVMITVLTPRFVPFFLILWIISNVSVSFYPIDALPGVFRYGYAGPFYNVSRTVRTILFNTKNDVALNFGVQLAWVGLSLITLPLVQFLIRRREVAAWEKEQEAKRSA
ncbi:hypothetical protein FIBSPDRAFT_742993 [Athelia psychrophila]|uniref:DUF3533 domain-containing protein n=1 Tax=Athelia psychrophila TaxID=1759441 RepID=A0A166ILS4_9AGAM|nr:hypothetical protein FIBSPDRAFT_742993 [Fibularhizoctonia sp. CBS 109695]